jgi:4-coumarate--CoA ligase
VQAIVAVGGIFTGSNPAYTVSELEHQIQVAEVKFVFAEPEILDPVIQAAQRTGLPADLIFVFNNTSAQIVPAGHKSWKHLLTYGEEDWVRFDSKEISEITPACRLFSSGTTGSPKAVQLTHYNLMAQHIGVMTADRRPYERIYIDSMPIFNASATPRLHFQNIYEGHVTYLLRRFDLNNVLQMIQDKKATELIIVPAMAIIIVMDGNARKYDLSSVRSVLVGAAPLDKSIQDRLREEVLSPGTRVVQGWGMTELCCTGTFFTWPEDDSTASIGRPINGLELK